MMSPDTLRVLRVLLDLWLFTLAAGAALYIAGKILKVMLFFFLKFVDTIWNDDDWDELLEECLDEET